MAEEGVLSLPESGNSNSNSNSNIGVAYHHACIGGANATSSNDSNSLPLEQVANEPAAIHTRKHCYRCIAEDMHDTITRHIG